MYIHTHNTTHTTMCTQDGACPLYSASQEGHDRVVKMLLQAGATVDLESKVEDYSLISVTCVVPCSVYSLYTKYHTTFRGIRMNVRKHITAADMHWRIKSFVHWKHVHLVHYFTTQFKPYIWYFSD